VVGGEGDSGVQILARLVVVVHGSDSHPMCCDCLPLPAFYQTTAFNSDLSEWDVSSVTTLYKSKCRVSGWIGNVHVVVGEGESQEC
jgi:surface protein